MGSAGDHCHTISATLIIHPNHECKRLSSRPTATWLRTVEKNLALQHLDLHTTWWRAQNRIT